MARPSAAAVRQDPVNSQFPSCWERELCPSQMVLLARALNERTEQLTGGPRKRKGCREPGPWGWRCWGRGRLRRSS